MDTNRHEDRWICFSGTRHQNASAILQCCALGVTMSWDDGFPGARASRPHDDGPPGSAGVPPAPSLAQPRPSPPLGSTGNGAMALLRPGRWGYCRRSGCLQSRAEAQRPPKGQHAGGTPALPGTAVPADRVAACSIAPKLSGGHRDSMRARRPRSRARLFPPCRADHSRKNGRSLMKTNHEWTRIDTHKHE